MGRAEHELAQLSSANEQLTAALAASEADGARALTAAQVRALRTSPHISPHTTMLFSSLLKPCFTCGTDGPVGGDGGDER